MQGNEKGGLKKGERGHRLDVSLDDRWLHDTM